MSSPVLKGQVVYEEHGGSGIWGKLGSILSGAGHVIASALPYVAQAASIYASSRGGSSSTSDYTNASWDLPNQDNRRIIPIPMPEPIILRPIPDYKSEPIARNALNELQQQQDYRQLSTSHWAELQARNQQILNELAAAKGLPNYQQFHQENGAVYDLQPTSNSLGVERFMQPFHQSQGFIQEDYEQIAQNLSQAQRPVSMKQLIQHQSSVPHPLNTSASLQPMMAPTNETRQQSVTRTQSQQPKLPAVHDKQYLNTRQQLLNNLFNSKV